MIYDMKGSAVGDLELADELLELKAGAQAVKEAVTAYRNAQRSGTASTLSKGEVAGSNRKPWRQKGTGQARAGYRQSPVWRGGAVAFGPKPRNFAVKVNRKVARLAFRRALSEKLQGGQVRVLDDLAMAEPKTKQFKELLKSLEIGGPALFVIDGNDRNIALSARNMPGVEVTTGAGLNVYQLLRYQTVVVTKAAVETLRSRLAGRPAGPADGDAEKPEKAE